MRSQWALLPLAIGLLSAAGRVAADQELDDRAGAPAITTSSAPASTQAQSSSEPASSSEAPTSSAPAPTTSGGGGDSTVTVTDTVTGGDSGSTVTNTVTSNSVTTVIVTSTLFDTSTTTVSNQDTATSTVWSTSTVIASPSAAAKRNIVVQTAPWQDVEASPTALAYDPAVTNIKDIYFEIKGREAAAEPEPAGGLDKRATVTKTVTTTIGGSDVVTKTTTKVLVSTTSSVTTATEFDTLTVVLNAHTTVTVTSTRTVTSTSVNGDVSTSTPDPNSGNDNSTDNSGGSGKSLSTGAIAGIGVGAGVAGLAILGGLLWFCLRKRRNSGKYDPDDTLGGGSEVPVGFGAGGGSRNSRIPSMSQNASSAGDAIGQSPYREPSLPKLSSPEGYRGTATGRAGYSKPEPYGAAYLGAANTVSSPSNTSKYSPTNQSSTLAGDVLPEHPIAGDADHSHAHAAELGHDGGGAQWQNPTAAEIDSQPARQRPQGPLYEMA